MSQTPPPYASYPRNTGVIGSSAQLQALSDGYFGLSKVFVINIVLALAFNALVRLSIITGPPVLVLILALGITVGVLTFGPNKKIGEGAGWSPAQPVVASVLMGINSALCCGIIGYVVMQTIASNHMKKFGVRGGAFGLKKSDVAGTIRDLEANEQNRLR